jgi:GH43 family beta-xylosidase
MICMLPPLRIFSIACLGLALCMILPLRAQNNVLVNPIIHQPDPFITRAAGNYILLATTGHNITLWASPHMKELGKFPKVVWTPAMKDPLQKLLTQVWSPTLWQFGNRWWIYFTATTDGANSGHGIFALRSETSDPLGPYVFAGQVDTGMPSIDPSVLRVNGTSYLMFVSVTGKNQVWIAPLADPAHMARRASLLIVADQPWEKQGGEIVEGPTALYHDGQIFLVYSGSHTASPAYCLGLLTYSGKGEITDAANWKKTGPVLEQSPKDGVYGPGRGTFTTSPDGHESWILYAAKTVSDFTGEGRSTRAQRFTYDKSGMPEFGLPVALGVVQAAPSGESGSAPVKR